MAEYLLGPEVRRIVTTHLASMDHMEVLVQLYRSAPEAIAVTEVSQRLMRPPELVETALGDLVEGGLAASVTSTSGVDEFKYDPRSQSLRNAVEELMTMYKERPVTLIRAIYDRPAEPVSSFAEAFRLRGGNDGALHLCALCNHQSGRRGSALPRISPIGRTPSPVELALFCRVLPQQRPADS